MWFALALLFFCMFLVAWRTIFPQRTLPINRPAPGVRMLFTFAVAMALATAVTRVIFPIGTSFYNFQLCYFPQYIAAFTVGLAAGRGDWVQELVASRRARIAGWLGLIGGPVAFLLLVFLGGAPAEGGMPGEHGAILYFGGWNPQAFGAAVWEQFAGLGLALGMMAWFQRSFNREGSAARWLSNRSFAVYVLHPPILVGLTLLFRSVQISPFLHVALLTITGLIASFAVADIVKRIPGLKKIL